jgi:hypothetical protein
VTYKTFDISHCASHKSPSKNIQRIQENRQANAVLIRKQKERIEKDIRDLRETMNNHLDKLQEKLSTELTQIELMITTSLHSWWFSMVHFLQQGHSCDLQNI